MEKNNRLAEKSKEKLKRKRILVSISILAALFIVLYFFAYRGRVFDTYGISGGRLIRTNVMISELMASNRSTIPDEDGDFRDWIELYNHGRSSVDLKGYGLSDDEDDLHKWQFPHITIEPGQYLVVFASGKDRSDPAGEYLHTNFRINMAEDNLFLSNSNGQLIEEVQISNLATDISYGKKPGNNGEWFYFLKPTPGRENSAEAFETLLFDEESQVSDVYINEIMASNRYIIEDEDRKFSDWIEIYNSGSVPVNLEGYFLSDEENNPFKWRFPDITIESGGYLLIFASGNDRRDVSAPYLHTNFKINRTEDELFFRDAEGKIINRIKVEYHLPNVSYGRSMEDKDVWLFFPTPTPGYENYTHGFETLLEVE